LHFELKTGKYDNQIGTTVTLLLAIKLIALVVSNLCANGHKKGYYKATAVDLDS